MTTPPPAAAASNPAATAKNWMGIVALILGILGLLGSCCFGSGFLLGAGAIVLGYLGKKAVQAGEANNGGMNQTGFVLGIVAVAISILFIVFIVILNVADFGYTYSS